MKYLLLLTILFSLNTYADFKLYEVDKLSIVYKKYFDGGRDPFLTQNGMLNAKLGDSVEIHFNTRLLRYLYWKNVVHGDTDESQFRRVGWQFQFGVNLHRFVSFGYFHHSQHMLDYSYPHGGFPVMDAFKIEFKFIDINPEPSIL